MLKKKKTKKCYFSLESISFHEGFFVLFPAFVLSHNTVVRRAEQNGAVYLPYLPQGKVQKLTPTCSDER